MIDTFLGKPRKQFKGFVGAGVDCILIRCLALVMALVLAII